MSRRMVLQAPALCSELAHPSWNLSKIGVSPLISAPNRFCMRSLVKAQELLMLVSYHFLIMIFLNPALKFESLLLYTQYLILDFAT